jgi:pimeloyl-ACP methyl ester carboxylesterase
VNKEVVRDSGSAIRWSCGVTTAAPSLYYDLFEPLEPSPKPPLICVHGGAHTGQCYERTPDGRPGWAVRFAEWGHTVYVPDWPGCGRSAYVPMDEMSGEAVCAGIGGLLDTMGRPIVLMTHSMSGAYGWQLLEHHGDRIAAVVAVAPGPPGNIQPEPTVLARGEDFVEVRGLALTWRLPLKAWMAPSDGFILDKLLGRSGRFPRHALDAYRSTLHAIAPRIVFQRQNVDGSQLRVVDAGSYMGKPVLIVTGEFDTDHPREIDGAVAAWLREQGAAADYWFLPDLGVGGNGHMLMCEENSDAIAHMIAGWIALQAC